MIAIALRGKIAPAYSLPLCLIASLPMRPYALYLLSEWTTFCLLSALFGFLFLALERKTPVRLTALASIISAIILTRPDYFYLAALPPLIFFKLENRSVRHLFAIGLGFIPILIWLSINYYRFGTPALTFYLGASCSVVSVLGPAAPAPDDPNQLREFLIEIAPIMKPASDSAIIDMLGFRTDKILELTGINFQYAFDHFFRARNLDWITFDRLLLRYSLRVVADNPARYLLFVFSGFGTILWAVPFIWASVIIPLRCLRKRAEISLAKVNIIFFINHAAHTIILSALGVMHLRYYAPSFRALFLSALMLILPIFRDTKSSSTPPA